MRNRRWDRVPWSAAPPSVQPPRLWRGGSQKEVPSELRWGRPSCGAHGTPGGVGSAPRAIPLRLTNAKPDCPAWRQEIPPGKRFQDGHKSDRRALQKKALRHTASILYSPVAFALRTLTLRWEQRAK